MTPNRTSSIRYALVVATAATAFALPAAVPTAAHVETFNDFANDCALSAHNHNDEFHMRGGADRCYILGGDDRLYGGDGSDPDLSGDGAADRVFGGPDNDDVWGQAGNDQLKGDDGADYVLGQSDQDGIEGNVGPDVVDGADRGPLDNVFGGDGTNDTCYVDQIAGIVADNHAGCEQLIKV